MKTNEELYRIAFDEKKYNAIRGGLICMAYELPHRKACLGMIQQLISVAPEDKLEHMVFGNVATASYEWVKEWEALGVLAEVPNANQQ